MSGIDVSSLSTNVRVQVIHQILDGGCGHGDSVANIFLTPGAGYSQFPKDYGRRNNLSNF